MNLSELTYFPKVSIVIPAYNASNYLSEAVNSALAQTYPNIEIIVVNDGSRDNGATRQIALSYGDNIRYFEKENGGSSSALNMGIANMTGEWFSWLSHDDLYTPDKVEEQIRYMNELGSSVEEMKEYVLFSTADLIDSQGRIIRTTDIKKRQKRANKVNSVKGNQYLIAEPTENNFHGCSCLIHKSVFEKVGCFDEKLRLLNDVDLWFRIYTAGYKVRLLPNVLVKGRVHSQQVSKSIGYSYHNPEQDMFWKRSFDWLKENCPNEYLLFIKYGCNAYLKTRNQEGNKAFTYAKAVNSKCTLELFIRKIYCICYAQIRSWAKSIYIGLKMGGEK